MEIETPFRKQCWINSIWKKLQNNNKKNGPLLHTTYRNQVKIITNLKIKFKIMTLLEETEENTDIEEDIGQMFANFGVGKCVFDRMQKYEPYKKKKRIN